MLSVSALACLAHAQFFAGELDETRRVALRAVERPDAPDVPDGYVGSLGTSLVDAEQGRPESAEGWARQALAFARRRFQANSWVASPAHLGLALACVATGRLDEAEREALRGERLRRSPQPTVGHAHALLVLAQVRLARSRLARCTGDLKRAKDPSRKFPTRDGCRRSRPRSSRPSSPLELLAPAASRSKNRVRPSSTCCEASRPVSPAGRSVPEFYPRRIR